MFVEHKIYSVEFGSQQTPGHSDEICCCHSAGQRVWEG